MRRQHFLKQEAQASGILQVRNVVLDGARGFVREHERIVPRIVSFDQRCPFAVRALYRLRKQRPRAIRAQEIRKRRGVAVARDVAEMPPLLVEQRDSARKRNAEPCQRRRKGDLVVRERMPAPLVQEFEPLLAAPAEKFPLCRVRERVEKDAVVVVFRRTDPSRLAREPKDFAQLPDEADAMHAAHVERTAHEVCGGTQAVALICLSPATHVPPACRSLG
jgi:hypothetical protein